LSFGQQWEKYIDEMFSGAKTCEVKQNVTDGHRQGTSA